MLKFASSGVHVTFISTTKSRVNDDGGRERMVGKKIPDTPTHHSATTDVISSALFLASFQATSVPILPTVTAKHDCLKCTVNVRQSSHNVRHMCVCLFDIEQRAQSNAAPHRGYHWVFEDLSKHRSKRRRCFWSVTGKCRFSVPCAFPHAIAMLYSCCHFFKWVCKNIFDMVYYF